MQDQSAVALSTASGNIDIDISARDRSILRDLAQVVAEIANRSIEDEKKKLWYKHNDLEKTRPLILCDPENGWNEIVTSDQIKCEGELA